MGPGKDPIRVKLGVRSLVDSPLGADLMLAENRLRDYCRVKTDDLGRELGLEVRVYDRLRLFDGLRLLKTVAEGLTSELEPEY